MRDLFDALKADGYVAINKIIKDREIETVQLEFKTKDDPTHGQLTKADRSVLGPALGALANSAGGLLIVGIDARRNERGVEATRPVPITGLARFQTDLVRATGELLMPRHEAIDVLAIEESAGSDVGFIAIWVDKSDRRPHMSQNERRYYKRAGDSSYRMEHHDIEDAFNRVAPPELEFQLSGRARGASYSNGDWNVRELYLDFSLINNGRLSACAPYVAVDSLVGGKILPIVSGTGGISMLVPHTYGPTHVFSGDANVFVHPGLALPACRFLISVSERHGHASQIGGRSANESAISFCFSYGCQHLPMRSGKFQISGNDLEDFASTSITDLLEKHQPVRV